MQKSRSADISKDKGNSSSRQSNNKSSDSRPSKETLERGITPQTSDKGKNNSPKLSQEPIKKKNNSSQGFVNVPFRAPRSTQK